MVGFFLFGVLYAEIISSFYVSHFRINAYSFGTFISLVYLISEVILKHLEDRAKLSNPDHNKYIKVRKIYYIIMCIMGFILFVMVPFVWWGAIRKLAESANKGIY
jgi:membrane-anchored glycerophosphoryl diester phosphodiesterase (GDPDase)